MDKTEKKATVTQLKIFTPAEVKEVFGAQFLDEEHCRQWILKKVHGETGHCPNCQVVSEPQDRFFSGARMKCRSCGKYYTALTGTFLCGTQFDFREIILLALFLEIGVANLYIAILLGVDQETVRIWRNRFNVLRTLQI